MTSAGCSLTTSAVYKIEDREAPRRISVDELIALSQILGTTVEDLLTPVEVLEKERARKLLKDLEEADDELVAVIRKFLDAYSELFSLTHEPELFEYVKGHHWRGAKTREEVVASTLVEGGFLVKDDIYSFALYHAYGQIYPALLDSADHLRRWNEQAARARAQHGTEDDGKH
jgi:hypothetical protein